MTRNSPITEISKETYWYVASTLNEYKDGDNVRPLDFAFVLHNARNGKGTLCSLSILLDGIAVQLKDEKPKDEAEKLLEKIRLERYQKLPSRFRCYFLSKTKGAAQLRAAEKFRNVPHLITQCHLIGDNYATHCGDIRIFDDLQNRPSACLADKYWSENHGLDESYTEVLFDGGLYFPNWREFPLLEEQTLSRWQEYNNREEN